jgi:hypothetical protein
MIRMSSVRTKDEDLRTRTLLLREVVELLMWEIAAISGRQWEKLPELKTRKSAMADRLRQFDWTPGPQDHESLDLMMLKSQISDLEYQSKRKIAVQLQMIRQQIDCLREQRQSRLECISLYFRKSPELQPSL